MNDDEFSQKVVEAFSIVSSSFRRFHKIELDILKKDDMALDIDNILEEVSSSPLITTLSGPGSGIIDTSDDSSSADAVDYLIAQVANTLTIIHYISKVYSKETPKKLNELAMKRVSDAIWTLHHEFPTIKGAYQGASRRQSIYKDRPRLAQSTIQLYLDYLNLAKDANKWLALYNSDHRDNQISDDAGHTSIPEK
jgi:hypothetical protein